MEKLKIPVLLGDKIVIKLTMEKVNELLEELAKKGIIELEEE